MALVGGLGCSRGGPLTRPPSPPQPTATPLPVEAVTGSIEATDQRSDGLLVRVDSVSLVGARGFVAVHAEAGGGPGPLVGHSSLFEGTVRGLTVKLDRRVSSGPLWLVLHQDANGNGLFDVPGPDEPVRFRGQVVMQRIVLTVG